MTNQEDRPLTWWECEPKRLARDQREVTQWCSDLTWVPEGAGMWQGRLPLWPFDRAEPGGLRGLIGQEGMPVMVVYGHAYPMVPPAVYPLDPKPELTEFTQTRFHVMGDGRLCLLQDASSWTGRDSIIDLLLKAAGWRVEYALIKAGVIEAMTISGIVNDASQDHLIARALEQVRLADEVAE